MAAIDTYDLVRDRGGELAQGSDLASPIRQSGAKIPMSPSVRTPAVDTEFVDIPGTQLKVSPINAKL